MSSTFFSSIKEQVSDGYALVFTKKWPSWLGGILISIVALMIFLWDYTWGIAGGYHNWGDWLFYLVHAAKEKPDTVPWLHHLSMSNFGILIGALSSALLSRQFKFRRAPRLEYIKGIVGGILMGSGAALAKGCNVGGFFSAAAMLDIGGYAMMVGLGIGAFIGLKYLLWEMEHLPQQQPPAPKMPKTGGIDWEKIKPYVGAVIIVAVIVCFYIYAKFDQTVIGGLLFFGFLIGLIMHRSRFCFVRAFREPFMTGEAEMVRAVSISLIIYGLFTAMIKFNYIQDPMMNVYHPFWIGSLLGGVIFGIGMLLAGGCASSTLWRAGEGHTKLMVTLVTFAVTNSAAFMLLKLLGLENKLGSPHLLPDVVGWQFTVPVFVLIALVWVVIANWNEKTEKLVIF